VAKGPGGRARFPRTGEHRFTIIDDDGGCGDGPPCEPGSVCVNGQCEPRGECVRDEDCPADERCVDGSCTLVEPCPEGCPPGEICVDGDCQGERDCQSDEDCSSGFSCESGVCVPEPGICGRVLCETGLYCDPQTGECIECRSDDECDGGSCSDAGFCVERGCGDDLFEPNNGLNEGSNIGFDVAFEGTLCGTDDDVFRLTDDNMRVVIEASAVGVDVLVLDANQQTQLEESINDARGLDFIGQAGWYVILSTARRSSIDYILQTQERPITECIDDRFEENDEREDASRLGATGAYVSGVICPDDPDWFRFRRRQTDEPTEILIKGGVESFAGLLQNSDGGELAMFRPRQIEERPYSSLVYEGNERDIFFRLGCPGCEQGLGYTMVTRSPNVRCRDDQLEPNDSPLAATVLPDSPGFELDEAIACPGNDDFYLFEASSGERRTITVAFSNARGDIDIGLLDGDAMVLDYQLSREDGHSVTIEPEAASRTFYLRVMLFGSREASYVVRVDAAD